MGRRIDYPEIQGMSGSEKAKYYTAAYRKRNPERMLWSSAKCRADKKGVEFSIKIEDIKIPKTCPILGIELVHNPQANGSKGGKENSPSLDRIDNTKGYHKDNIQVISHKANSMKFTADNKELIMFADWIYKTYG